MISKSATIFFLVLLLVACFYMQSYSEELLMENIGGDIFCIHYEDQNTCFFKFGEDLYIIDTFSSIALAEKQKKMITAKFKDVKNSYLINTLIKSDSIIGNDAFKDGVKIISSIGSLDLNNDKSESTQKKQTDEPMISNKGKSILNKVAIAFEGELRFYNDNKILDIIDSNKTEDLKNIIVNNQDKNTVFAGILFWNKIIPDLKGIKIRNYQSELEKIIKMNPTKIVPKYGTVGNYDDFLKFKEYIDTLITETQNNIKKGSTIEQTLDNVKLEKFNTWKFYAERHPINVQNAYNELKNENNQILEFLKAIQQNKENKENQGTK
jgi:hypothetical protein